MANCEYCGDRLGPMDYVANGEGKLLHYPEPNCFDAYRKSQDYLEVSKGGI